MNYDGCISINTSGCSSRCTLEDVHRRRCPNEWNAYDRWLGGWLVANGSEFRLGRLGQRVPTHLLRHTASLATSLLCAASATLLPADGLCATIVLSTNHGLSTGDHMRTSHHNADLVLLGTGPNLHLQHVCRSLHWLLPTGRYADNIVPITITLRCSDELRSTGQ